MNIKKFFVLSALAAMSATQICAQEQQAEPTWKFLPHWYLQLQAGASETLGEAKFFDLVSPAVQAAVGYQFNPYLGARVKVSGWQAKGGWCNPEQTYKFNQLGLEADLRLDLTNLIGGFNPERLVSIGIFAGAGANMAWDNDEAQDLYTHNYNLPYIWDGTKIRPVGNAGVDINFRLSQKVQLGLEANARLLSDKFNSKKAGNADWMFNALVGVKVALGKTAERQEPPAPPVQPVVEEKPATPVAPVARKPVKPVEVKDIDVNIFFDIRSAEIREAEAVKLQEIATYLKTNGTKTITISGYADKETGNPTINQKYSEERVNAVKAALVEAGISESRITTIAKGDSEQPFNDNDSNRVCICISK